jgi:hypothetical protein
MPIELKFLDKGAGVVYRFKGLVTGKELIKTNEEVFSSPERLRRVTYVVIDQVRLASLNVSIAELLKIARQNSSAAGINSQAVVALIAVSDLALGLSQVWGALTENIPWQTKVFMSEDEAYAWTRAKVKENFATDPTFV